MGIKVVETSYSAPTAQILATPDHYVAIGVSLQKDSPLATVVGTKKIVKSGTIYPSNDGNAQGIILNDYDVTDGDANAALILHGFVKLSALPVAPASDAIAALPNISFLGKKTVIKSATAAPLKTETAYTMTVNLYGTEFTAACTTASNWTLVAGNTLIVLGTITKVDAHTVTIGFTSAGLVADTFTITAKAAAVANGVASNTISKVIAA